MSQTKFCLVSEFRKDFTLPPEESFIICHTYLGGKMILNSQRDDAGCVPVRLTRRRNEECILAGLDWSCCRLSLWRKKPGVRAGVCRAQWGKQVISLEWGKCCRLPFNICWQQCCKFGLLVAMVTNRLSYWPVTKKCPPVICCPFHTLPTFHNDLFQLLSTSHRNVHHLLGLSFSFFPSSH